MLCKNSKRIVTVATNAELLNPHYYARLQLAARNINISRRNWYDELSSCFCGWGYSYDVQYPSGEPYPVPDDIDEVMGNDPDARWISLFLELDDTGMRPRFHSRKLERVRLIDLYFRIKHPNIARHFGR